ncbi:MAG TPA: hypothetical protein VJ810_10050 [Blastocatellia bacterium]|nr:hypothetical protein [Blastocatellia bacterium]
MELIINDLPEHGVVIHGPESPGFRERLLSLFKDLPELDDDALRYSVIVENQTPQHILEMRLIWSPYPHESGTPFSQGAGSSNNPLLNNLWGSLIKPGEQCPWSLMDGHCFMRQKVVYATGGDARRMTRDHVKKRLEASDKCSVDIDYVLFGDGVFAGQDTALQFDQFEATNRGTMDMIAELNQKLDDGEDAFAYAEQCALITMEQIQALYPDPRLYARSPEIVYTWEKKMAAKAIVAQWQVTGKQVTIEWIREKANPRIPLPERFRPDISKMDEGTQVRFRAMTDLIAELIQKLDEGADIFAHAEGYASITRPQIEALYPDARAILPNLERTYAMSKKTAAMNVINRREKSGEPATVEWIRASAKSQIPLVRR